MATQKPEEASETIVKLGRRNRTPMAFNLQPDDEARAEAARTLGIDAVRKLRFEGELRPEGDADWRLVARLGATVVQPCIVTLAPVTTRIDADVARSYLADFVEPEADEVEMPEDDTAEPLPDRVDLSIVMIEALALALPDYPRAPNAELGAATFTRPGVTPMSDDDAKPLAGLAALRDRLSDGRDDGSDDD